MANLQPILQFQDPSKLGLFFKIMFRIFIFRFLISWVEMPSLLKSLDQSSRKRMPFGKDDLEWARLSWKYANFLLIHCFRTKHPCLLRSLVLFRLFRREGLDVQIHFGVKKNEFLLEGHSWLLLNGDALLEQTDPQLTYTQVYSFPNEGNQSRSTRQDN